MKQWLLSWLVCDMALLLWSGGCDSTILLYDLLTAEKNHDKLIGRYVSINADEHIRTISINDSQVAGSKDARKARDVLLPLLRKRYKTFVHGEITIKRKGLFVDQPCYGLSQPAMWLFHASSYLDANEDLYAGYIKGDDIWHYQGWLYSGFDAIQKLTHRTGQLRLPLEWVAKSEVVHRLKKARLLKHTWYCELSETGRPCRKCASCKTHMTAVWLLKQGIYAYDDEKPKVEYDADKKEWKPAVSESGDTDGDRQQDEPRTAG